MPDAAAPDLVRWTSVFLDLAPGEVERGAAYWAAVTGYDAAAVADEDREFPPLAPPDGDAYLYVQRVGDPPSRVHLDLHVDDMDAALAAALAAGAELVERRDHAVLGSPFGMPFCLVTDPGSERPSPARWPGGRSQVEQLCLDVSHSAWPVETAFWRSLTGWPVQGGDLPEFADVIVPERLPLRLLLQRRGDDDGPTRAHLDLSTDDRSAEVARHEALGGSVVEVSAGWTVMRDPLGTTYCVTDAPVGSRRQRRP